MVEDDPNVSNVVVKQLKANGLEIDWAKDLFKARSFLAKKEYDLVILDRRLPDGDGLELCRELRENANTKSIAIIFLSSQKSVEDRVLGLNLGGDDYLPKPFASKELVARVNARLRKPAGRVEGSNYLVNGNWKLDLPKRKAMVDGKEIKLTRKEFDLLQALLESGGRVLSRNFLLEKVWGYDPAVDVSSRVVDSTMYNLRSKLGPSGSRINSVIGHGYRLEQE